MPLKKFGNWASELPAKDPPWATKQAIGPEMTGKLRANSPKFQTTFATKKS